MARSIVSKVMWVGRATVFLVGLAVILALVLGVASMALGANGGNFILGQNNTATLLTKLTGNVSGGPALQVANPNTATGSRGLQVNVAEGKSPLLVNATAGKALNLNSDKLDGNNSTAFLPSEIYSKSLSQTIPANNFDNGITLYCDSGDVAVSGSYRIAKPGAYLQVFGEERVDERFDREQEVLNPSAWHVYVDNPDTENAGTITVFVHCADRPPLRLPPSP